MSSGENEKIELNDSNTTNTGETKTSEELKINVFFYIGIVIKIVFWLIFYFNNLPSSSSSSSGDSFFNDEEFDLGKPVLGLIMVLISTFLIFISNMNDTLPYPDIFLSIFLFTLLSNSLNKQSFYVFLMVFIYLTLSSVYFVMNSTIILNGSNDTLKFLYLVETVLVIFVLVYTISKTF